MDRWRKLETLARVAPRKPREVMDRVSHLLEVRWDSWRSRPGPYHWLTPTEGEQRLASTLGLPASIAAELAMLAPEVERGMRALPPTGPIDLIHCAVGSLARAAFMLCRATRPAQVVETGVAYGVTTRHVLEALERNRHGHLESIDLPPLGDEAGAHIGALVTPALRPRWTLQRGSTRRLLPAMVQRLDRVDVFIHDSLHTERTMRWEFETVWPHLPEGGVLLSDDVDGNAAFHDFVRHVAPRDAWTVRDTQERGYFGVIIK